MLNSKAQMKEMAAHAALKFIESDQVIGIGSGSTVEIFIQLLKKRISSEKLKILTVPTSYQSAILLANNRIPITTLNEYPELDIAVDGADELTPELNLIKGGGGALTQEKIVDSMAKKFIVIADESKLVEKLGISTAIPIEIIPMAMKSVILKLKTLSTKIQLREAIKKMGPVVTDNGNFILDVMFQDNFDLKKLELKLNNIPGVIENGLFIDLADIAYLGTQSGLKEIKK